MTTRTPIQCDTTHFAENIRQTVADVLRDHPELPRPGQDYAPWVTGCLGDPRADVWFIAENPSATTAKRARADATVEDQWTISPGDKLFRQMLVDHGFKGGTWDSPGDWRCYITDVIKSEFIVNGWNARTAADRKQVAEWWAPVLDQELAIGKPRVLVTVGARAEKLVKHVELRGLLSALPAAEARIAIKHYVFVMSRPEGGIGGGDPARIKAWADRFAEIGKLQQDALRPR
jgi:hypothetical protein